MTQEELVKKAIDILIQGDWEVEYTLHHDEYCRFKLDNCGLSFNMHNELFYYNSMVHLGYYIFFDKAVKNMCLLSVLLRDWCNKMGRINKYEEWIETEVGR